MGMALREHSTTVTALSFRPRDNPRAGRLRHPICWNGPGRHVATQYPNVEVEARLFD
jgi:hypothetical protein